MISNTLSKFEHNFILQLFLHRGDLYQIVHLKNWVGVHFTNWHLTLGSWWSWSFLACINFLEMKSSVYEDVGKYSISTQNLGIFSSRLFFGEQNTTFIILSSILWVIYWPFILPKIGYIPGPYTTEPMTCSYVQSYC